MYDEGHQIASHTWSHPDLCNITSAQRKDEMYKNEMAIRNVVGVIPTYMRPPFSSCTAGKSFFQTPPLFFIRLQITNERQNAVVKQT